MALNGLHPRAVAQPREADVLTQMDFALFGGALSLLGQHSHLPDYSPQHPQQCQDGPGARKRSENDPRLSGRFEIPWEARRVSREQSSREQTCSILCSLSVLGTATALAGWACRRAPGLSKSPEGTTWGCCQGRVYCPQGTQNTPQTDHLWMRIFHHWRLFGLKVPPSPFPSASLCCWHSAAETWSNQCSYGEVCLAWKMILLNRSIKFVSVFADNFHEYITLKYGTSILTYSLWCSKWLAKNPSVIW